MNEMRNLKKELNEGGHAAGVMVGAFASPTLMQILKNCGCEVVFIDMEHGVHSYESVAEMVAFCRALGMVPLVRAPQANKECLQKIWDMGTRIVAIPMVETVEQAKEFVKWSKYAPMGEKGCGPFQGNMDFDFSANPMEFFKSSNEECILLIQPETKKGVENLEAILDVPGVDGILTGPFDLAFSMGVPGNSPEFAEVNDYIFKTCKNKGKIIAGFGGGTPEQTKKMMDDGLSIIFSGSDVAWVYQGAMKAMATTKAIEGF